MVTIRRSRVLVTLLALIGIPGGALAQSPGPQGSGGSDPVLEAVILMNKVPVGVRESCVPSEPVGAGVLALVECVVGDHDGIVWYVSFEDPASVGAAFDRLHPDASVEGAATSCAEGPFMGTYSTAEDVEAGKVICWLEGETLWLEWTDVRNRVLGLLQIAEEDYSVLDERWRRVRLDASVVSDASPSASVAPRPSSAPSSAPGELAQWAIDALASSEYASSDGWSASEATGEPDTSSYGDQPTAWAPSTSDGAEEWIELAYEHVVVPTAVDIHESSGAGFVTRVEAWDDTADAWVVLWEGTDPSPDELTVFSPQLAAVTLATDRIRLTTDTSGIGWNEIDAVRLVGTHP